MKEGGRFAVESGETQGQPAVGPSDLSGFILAVFGFAMSGVGPIVVSLVELLIYPDGCPTPNACTFLSNVILVAVAGLVILGTLLWAGGMLLQGGAFRSTEFTIFAGGGGAFIAATVLTLVLPTEGSLGTPLYGNVELLAALYGLAFAVMLAAVVLFWDRAGRTGAGGRLFVMLFGLCIAVAGVAVVLLGSVYYVQVHGTDGLGTIGLLADGVGWLVCAGGAVLLRGWYASGNPLPIPPPPAEVPAADVPESE